MNDIDTKSKEFIKWCEEKFEDEDYIYRLYHEIMQEVIELYLDSPHEALRAEILDKMITGAREHGAPKKAVSTIEGEIRKEMIDLVGWSLMKRYREEEV